MKDPNSSAAGRSGPLSGLKVIDLSNFLAGPSVSMHLGDLGAEVIKVEQPGSGDEFRGWGLAKNGVGLYFKVINRNKKSVTADLRTPMGVEIVRRLAATADVLVENYRPGTLERWGLGYEELTRGNPGLVLLRLSGYGQSGPNSAKPAFGTALEGYAGAAYISGFPDRPPLLPGYGLADGSAGIMGAFLALAAIQGRGRNGGRGQVVDLALYEAAFALLGPMVVEHDQLGVVQERMGSRVPWVAPRNTYRARDGRWVAVSASSQATFARLCEALDAAHLVSDARFRDNRLRVENVQALDDALQDAMSRFDRDTLIRRLESSGAVVGPVNSIADIADDPHIRARGSIASVEDQELGGTVRMQNFAGRLSDTPGEIRSAGPRLGEHNGQVLVEQLGFSQAELEAAGIVFTTPGAA